MKRQCVREIVQQHVSRKHVRESETIGLDFPHVAAKDHGLDVVAIYRTRGAFGLSLVESKAYRMDPNAAITSAVGFYKTVENGTQDPRIRQVVNGIRGALSEPLRKAISPSLWKEARTYIPNPHYDSAAAVNWTNPRPSFKALTHPVVVMPHQIPNFKDFFDDVANAMRMHAANV